jgi:hypothetical protein
MTLALQSTHIKYGLHCLACPGNEQLTFFFLPHSASLYTGKLVTLACAGERKAKKKKKKVYVGMNLAHVHKPTGKCPVEMNCEDLANIAVCIVPSVHHCNFTR